MTTNAIAPPHLQAVLDGTHQSLSQLFSQAPHFSPLVNHPASAPLENEVSVLVGFTGGLQGQILMGMQKATAMEMAGTLLMSPVEDFDPIAHSAVAEVANMVAGSCATTLHEQGFATNITVPSVISGSQVQVSWPNFFVQKVVITLPFGLLTLAIGLKVT